MLAALWTALCVARAAGVAGEDGRPGTVQLSNGEVITGLISTTPGSCFRMQAGNDLKDVALAAVQELRFHPERESLEQKWRFIEAGRTAKKKWGKPYPIRELGATLCLASGQTLTGHLYTTVLYIQRPEETTKLVIKAKDKGGEGQALKDVVYPVRIVFADAAVALPGDVQVDVGDAKNIELVVLEEGSLLRLEARADRAGSGLILPGLTAAAVFAAVRRGDALSVGWLGHNDAELVGRIVRALPEVEDFFDSRQLLGVWRKGDEIYSLLLLRRLGKSTLNAEKSQPWRLEVWRWREHGAKLMLAGRGYFFRGILGKNTAAPAVKLVPEMWQMTFKDKVKLP